MATLLGGSGSCVSVGRQLHHRSCNSMSLRCCVLFTLPCRPTHSIIDFGSLLKPSTYARKPQHLRSYQKSTLSLCGSVASSNSSSVTFADEGLAVEYTNLHHVGLLCQDLEHSLNFYCGILGLQVNNDRPADKLPYRGAWLWVGSGMIHLMELPNPDPISGRPSHGGRDRHACVAIKDVNRLKEVLDKTGVPYTASKSGRPAVFTRDPDGNALEFAQFD